jgi:cellobiose phosphorylase
MIYEFRDNHGSFKVEQPQIYPQLYFPLTDKDGKLLSSISPNLGGDLKQDNQHFLMPPASIQDIKDNFLCRRDFFINIEGSKIIRASQAKKQTLNAGLLYHQIIQDYSQLTLEITNFIPYNCAAEVMQVKVKNKTGQNITFTPTSFIPLYGRGAHNLRDHRHVTSLLNRLQISSYGITLKPTMVFAESGHKINKTHYFVRGYQDNKIAPKSQFPTLESFCRPHPGLSHPGAVYNNLTGQKVKKPENDGKEACAAFRFSKKRLLPGQETNYYLIIGIAQSKQQIKNIFNKLDRPQKVKKSLQQTKRYWRNKAKLIDVNTEDPNYNGWFKWVNLQPIFRKLFGCSFLPHFDYGKGGRGWRDLWQDALTLLLIEPTKTKQMIIDNFKGVRIDGSNATIITKDNKFIADRNKITRVWMDHGVWPYLTLKEYIHRTGDITILNKKTNYFRDPQLMRAQSFDTEFNSKDNYLKTKQGKNYQGTILEHILVEVLSQFFNVGRHQMIRLENGDWNDGLDMAPDKGESVAFSCMYGFILKDICCLLKQLKKTTSKIKLARELSLLLKPVNQIKGKKGWRQKQEILQQYLSTTKSEISGQKLTIDVEDLISNLWEKGDWLIKQIRKQEWLKQSNFFNGYYDNKGRRAEGIKNNNIYMMLPSQVFAILSGTATSWQIKKTWRSINKYLSDPQIAGFRLNTNFKKTYLELGRAFAFSYGDKENGSFFSHMIVLLAFAFYRRGFVDEGFTTLKSLYQMSKSDKSHIYPMLPEYFNSQGRGLYGYLTGSASWYTYTLLSQAWGIKGYFGSLHIKPQLTKEQLTKKGAHIRFKFAAKKFRVNYYRCPNSKQLKINHVYLNQKQQLISDNSLVITKETLKKLPANNVIDIYL